MLAGTYNVSQIEHYTDGARKFYDEIIINKQPMQNNQ